MDSVKPSGPVIAGAAAEVSAGGLALSLTPGPQDGDQVIEESDVQVFVQPDAAVTLDDQALDAQVSQDGEVSFVLTRQA